jgi:hypothetical protein
MSEEFNVGIILDTSEAKRDVEEINHEVNQANHELEETKRSARDTMIMTMTVVRSSYAILRGVLIASGMTIDAVTNAVIQSTLRLGQQFYTIATAQSVTPGMQAAAIITAIQAGIIIASAIQYEEDRKKATDTIQATNLMLNGMNRGFSSIL